jgi:hypothetical protein
LTTFVADYFFSVFSISAYTLTSAAESTSQGTFPGAMEVARRKDDTLPGGRWPQDQLQL